ncbi:MAG: YvrJ family protein [Clostridium sp.]|nr:YvrJ family protein [Clostridium sp.]
MELIEMIQNLGFPIFISIYLLVRFEKKIDTLDNTINLLNTSIIKLIIENEQEN